MNVTRIAVAAASVASLAIGNGELTKESVYNRTFTGVCVCASFLFLFIVAFVVAVHFFIHVGTTWRKWCALAATKVHHARFIVTHTAQWKQQTNRWCSTNGQNNDTSTKTHSVSEGERENSWLICACVWMCAYLRTQRLTLILPRIFSCCFSREGESAAAKNSGDNNDSNGRRQQINARSNRENENEQ